ncbi:hypothetical protein VIBC2010_11201 [Vibrio caribbeanicus ATCC BAA-2122]|uniref:Uncharacterized protein n=1 Tax=Vibrio caribbeanicus ATCC BAA-2122 TaxID=796620 RepID=E3BN26_9VIBR|nr:hypothetical protein VIBC2010_11201 [Vibrio caribbeanicus ATCC BAA-2122]
MKLDPFWEQEWILVQLVDSLYDNVIINHDDKKLDMSKKRQDLKP